MEVHVLPVLPAIVDDCVLGDKWCKEKPFLISFAAHRPRENIALNLLCITRTTHADEVYRGGVRVPTKAFSLP